MEVQERRILLSSGDTFDPARIPLHDGPQSDKPLPLGHKLLETSFERTLNAIESSRFTLTNITAARHNSLVSAERNHAHQTAVFWASSHTSISEIDWLLRMERHAGHKMPMHHRGHRGQRPERFPWGAWTGVVTTDPAMTSPLSSKPGLDSHPSAVVSGGPNTGSENLSGVKAESVDDSLTVTGVSIDMTEGQGFSGTVGTISGILNAFSSAAAVEILWGDGSVSSQRVTDFTPDGNGHDVYNSAVITSSHAYAEAGAYTISLSVTPYRGQATGPWTGTSLANVADAPLIVTSTHADFSLNEEQSVSGTLATFQDLAEVQPTVDPLDVNEYSATIDWGDGTMTAGTLSLSAGGYVTISGTYSHGYEPGRFRITVTLHDDDGSTASAVIVAVVTDPAGPELVVPTGIINEVEGQPFNAALASFQFTPPLDPDDGLYISSIDWGDGTRWGGNGARLNDDSNYIYHGQHTYVEDGTYTVTLKVQTASDDGEDAGDLDTYYYVTDTIIVAEPTLGLIGAGTLNAVEGQSFTGTVATVANSVLLGQDPDCSVTINWGDGKTSPGSISGTSIVGTHTYAEEATYAPKVTVTDDGQSASASDTMVVTEPTLTLVVGGGNVGTINAGIETAFPVATLVG
ncbi:hypothetical protein ACYOEI_21380, partial [Singulisphaera rosea]